VYAEAKAKLEKEESEEKANGPMNGLRNRRIVVAGQTKGNNSRQKVGKPNLKCIYTNACSIINKITVLKAIACNYEPDVIGIKESWWSVALCQTRFGCSASEC